MSSAVQEQHSHLDSLEDQVERYKQVLDVMPAGVILLDTQGIVREANPEAQRLLDVPLVGEKWYSVIQIALLRVTMTAMKSRCAMDAKCAWRSPPRQRVSSF